MTSFLCSSFSRAASPTLSPKTKEEKKLFFSLLMRLEKAQNLSVFYNHLGQFWQTLGEHGSLSGVSEPLRSPFPARCTAVPALLLFAVR